MHFCGNLIQQKNIRNVLLPYNGRAPNLCSVHSGHMPQESATLNVILSPSWSFQPRCLTRKHINVTLPYAEFADGSFQPGTIAAENVAADPFDDTDT